MHMRIAFLLAGPIALALAAGQPAFAQGLNQGAPGQATPTEQGLNLTMQDQHVLKEILLKDKNIPHADMRTPPKIGDAVPASVTLHDFPEPIASKVAKVKSHQFFIADGEIAIVRPQGRKVADVVK